ncbi:MAG: type II secretion system F family protein [Candidatus Omnitrophota bacterium]|jgi:general secretion pathway protein F
MPVYTYRAKKDPQNIIEGRVEGRSEKEAIEKISLLGYIPIHIEECASSAARETSSFNRSIGKIRSAEVTIISRQLASLLKSGVPILASLNIIAEQSENTSLKTMVRNVHDAVKEGSTFSATLMQYPDAFPPIYIAMIRVGEDSGSLPEMLLRISDYRSKQEEMFARFRMAMAYPMLMAMVGVGTIIFMLTFVMPRLLNIYLTMEQKLPLPTQILINTSKGLRDWGGWILLIMIAVIFVAAKQLKSAAGRSFLSVFKLHIPVFGKFILKAELSRFCRTLELLIQSGIPILKALEVGIPILENEVIKGKLRNSYKDLEQGGSFGRSLKNASLFPLFMTNLIIVGEESGKLDEALSEVASSYERDTDEAMKVMSSLLEPLMILGIGLIVGFIVIAMLLPIFEINVMAH